ncbi:MAG: twin-arginine translocase subunit TatC [Deltaproteobacteria bacterium]|nr:twin-arginine translocase subunit TatC [Deltaproteobacteria bacterium]
MSPLKEEEKLPFTDHLEELRRRLIISVIAIAVGFIVSYFFSKQLFEILMKPLIISLPPKSTLIFTSLPEAFFTYLKVSLLSGIFLASPVVLYEMWAFISPGLYKHEKRYVVPFVLFSSIFFIGGALFGYFVVFPFGFKFFLGFATDYIRPMPTIKEYFGFCAKLLFAFGVIFELPLFVLFLSRIGIVNEKMLRKQRKYAILLVFVTSAILTPPDVMTQLMMAGPLLALYEISIWVAKVFGRKKTDEELEEKEEEEKKENGESTPETAPDKEEKEVSEADDVPEEDELSPEEEAEELDKP